LRTNINTNTNTNTNNNNQLLEYYTYDIINNNDIEEDKIDENNVLKYSISDKILNNIN
jgi:hypothetical protein